MKNVRDQTNSIRYQFNIEGLRDGSRFYTYTSFYDPLVYTLIFGEENLFFKHCIMQTDFRHTVKNASRTRGRYVPFKAAARVRTPLGANFHLENDVNIVFKRFTCEITRTILPKRKHDEF